MLLMSNDNDDARDDIENEKDGKKDYIRDDIKDDIDDIRDDYDDIRDKYIKRMMIILISCLPRARHCFIHIVNNEYIKYNFDELFFRKSVQI